MYEYVKPQQGFLDGGNDYGMRGRKSASTKSQRPPKHIGNDIRVCSNVLQRKVITSDGREVYDDTEKPEGVPGGVPLSTVMGDVRAQIQDRYKDGGKTSEEIEEIISEVEEKIKSLMKTSEENVESMVDQIVGLILKRHEGKLKAKAEENARTLFDTYKGKSAEELKDLSAEKILDDMQNKGFKDAEYKTSEKSSINDNIIVQTHPIGKTNPLYGKNYKNPLLFVEIHPKGGIHASSYILFTFKTENGAAERYKVIFSKEQNYVGNIEKEQNTTHLWFTKEDIRFRSKAEMKQQAKASGGAPLVAGTVPGSTGAKPKASVRTGIVRSQGKSQPPTPLSPGIVEGLGKVKVGAFAKRKTIETELFRIERGLVSKEDRERINQAFPYFETMNTQLPISPLSVQHVMQLIPYTEDGIAFWRGYQTFRQNHPEFRYELSPVQVINFLDNRHPGALYIMDDDDWIRYEEFKRAHTEFIYSFDRE